jgi:hypothetical protein
VGEHATSLHTLQEEEEKKLQGIMLEELNKKFALQLDLESLTNRSSQLASDYRESDSISMILAGSSHSARTLDSIDRASINLLDATVPGFRINPNNVAKMASEVSDLVEGMDPKNTVVVIQILPITVVKTLVKCLCQRRATTTATMWMVSLNT